MNEELATIQAKAARTCGEDKGCKEKMRHPSFAKASGHSKALNLSKNKRHDVEPYFCCFCVGWHVGRIFSTRDVKIFSLIADFVDEGYPKIEGIKIDLVDEYYEKFG